MRLSSFLRSLVIGLVLLFSAYGLVPVAVAQKAIPVTADPVVKKNRVMLTQHLPPVGDQGKQGSCVAWAVGYACLSYLEAQQQKNKPTDTHHIFSPAFIYNQINHHKDKGSSIDAALELLKSKGCATLATMPYDQHNFTRQPSEAAVREAARHRIGGYKELSTGREIREALAQRQIVVLSVVMDPKFQAGKFKRYTTVGRQKGLAAGPLAKDVDQHHAMCVVGYDDDKKAYLLMNSWGKGWGQNGFCWVSYGLLQKISKEGDTFARAAYAVYGPGSKGSLASSGPPAASTVSGQKAF
jgi:C1A family cysteine protease